MQFQALNDYVGIKPIQGADKTPSGLIKPTSNNTPTVMEITSIGPDVGDEFEIGDKVCIDKIQTVEFDYENTKNFFIKRNFIYAKLKED